MQKCPLCHTNNDKAVLEHYYDCSTCFGRFLVPEHYLSSKVEKDRYLEHNNDVHDKNYQQFVSPITNTVLANHSPNESGLDFGAGPGPVIAKVLEDNNYTVAKYDPFFHNTPELLNQTYDYIVCCEVIEHFHNPNQEFSLLKKLLNPGGKLYCMTHLYEDNIDFKNWYYKNDPTHVFFYRKETIEWIKEEYRFADFSVDGRLIILSS